MSGIWPFWPTVYEHFSFFGKVSFEVDVFYDFVSDHDMGSVGKLRNALSNFCRKGKIG